MPSELRGSMSQDKWKWFGNAGHFICGQWCRFHLTTQVGKYLVSTVGELWLERGSRESHAKVYDPKWFTENSYRMGDDFDYAYMKHFGYEEVGAGRKFETMVFKIDKFCNAKGCNCGMPIIVPSELDAVPANTAKEATKAHYKLCKKWSKKS